MSFIEPFEFAMTLYSVLGLFIRTSFVSMLPLLISGCLLLSDTFFLWLLWGSKSGFGGDGDLERRPAREPAELERDRPDKDPSPVGPPPAEGDFSTLCKGRLSSPSFSNKALALLNRAR